MGCCKQYKEKREFQLKCKMIIALAFVPDKFIQMKTEKLIDYFSNTNENLVELLLWLKIILLKKTFIAEKM